MHYVYYKIYYNYISYIILIQARASAISPDIAHHLRCNFFSFKKKHNVLSINRINTLK